MLNFNRQQIIALLLLALLSTATGYFIAYSTKPNPSSLNKPQELDLTKPNPFFQIQTAVIPSGEIIALSNNKATVINEKNQKAEFPLSRHLVIYKPLKSKLKEATSSSDIKSIQLNQLVTIVVSSANGRFEITEISYIPQPK